MSEDIKQQLTYEELNSIFKYVPETGELIYKISRGSIGAGFKAGNLHKTGYLQVQIKGKAYLVHRIVWFLHHKEWPVNNIDHIDRNKLNNKIDNLRDYTQKQNMSNRSMNVNNTSGYSGVSYHKPTSKWVAKYGTKSIGYFETPDAANKARESYLEKLHNETTILR